MSALLRAELIKLRTTRTFFALVAVATALTLLVVTLSTLFSSGWQEDDLRGLLSVQFAGFFILLLGVIGMGGEWRHRTIASTVLAAPDRTRLLAAKVVAYAVAGAVLSLAVTLAAALVATLVLGFKDEPALGIAPLADLLWRNLVVAALLGALGVCAGALVRNQVVAIVGLLIYAVVVEQTVLGLYVEVGRYGPTTGAPAGIQDLDEELLSAPAALLVMLGWIGVLFAAAAALLRRRDLL